MNDDKDERPEGSTISVRIPEGGRRERPHRSELPKLHGLEPPPEHDLLVLPKTGALPPWKSYRFVVHKQQTYGESGGPVPGTFDAAPETWGVQDIGQRRLYSVARPGEAEGDVDERGPAIAVLPVKPEPGAASVCTCFLLNVNNFNVPNLWTVEEWEDGPGGVDFETPEHPDDLEVLLAAAHGRVLRLQLKGLSKWKPGVVQRFDGGEIEAIDLSREVEVWSQLRNGTVAGTVSYRGKRENRTIPLVNVTSLQPDARIDMHTAPRPSIPPPASVPSEFKAKTLSKEAP